MQQVSSGEGVREVSGEGDDDAYKKLAVKHVNFH